MPKDKRVSTTDITAVHERERLTNGSYLHNVIIRWNGGMVKVACQDKKHATALMTQLDNAAYVDVTTY